MKRSYEIGLSLAAMLLCAIPFFASAIPPMTDVSQHVLVARVLLAHQDPALAFDRYFDVHWALVPGSLFYLLLAGLQRISKPYVDAQIYLTGWVVCLWASVYYLARTTGQQKPWLAALAILPVTFCWYVYMGFLPFLMTIPLFALTMGLWHSRLVPRYKLPLIALALCVSFLFHVVGAMAAIATLCVAALWERLRGGPSRTALWFVPVAVAPVMILVFMYLFGKHSPTASVQWTNPLMNFLYCIKFTACTLSSGALALLLIWLGGIALAWGARRAASPQRTALIVQVIVLALAACIVPRDLGALWPAGPRLFPFALVLLVVSIPWETYRPGLLVGAVIALLAGLSAATSIKAASLGREYQDFTSGIAVVAPGSRVLPILVNPHEGSRWVDPFWSISSAYTIARGGENPYVFAVPYIQTAASPLVYRYPETRRYAFLFDPHVRYADYVGVSCAYDYVILWGQAPQLESVLAREMELVHRQGSLAVYGLARHGRSANACLPRSVAR